MSATLQAQNAGTDLLSVLENNKHPLGFGKTVKPDTPSGTEFMDTMTTMGEQDRSVDLTRARTRGCFATGCISILVLMLLAGSGLYWFYGMESRHENRNTVWPLRGRSLIPPAASDITLHRDLLTHYAVYTIPEKELNEFLDERFAFPDEDMNSFSERSRPREEIICKPFGRFDFPITEETVLYSYPASNGGVSDYYHNPTTGQTYQVSEYW